MGKISPLNLRRLLQGDEELALIDVREQGKFSEAHLLFAACIPLSRLELLVGDLIPRSDTRIVIVDDSNQDETGRRAAARLLVLGYRNVGLLEGGVEAWQAADLELFSGVNVPSKAFGEFVEHQYDTPRLAAAEVKEMLDNGINMVIVDSRPYDEYHNMNIPTATDMPGAELAYRIHDIAPDPETMVVVNCAGRTRSIIGAQSLINAGIPNRVAALKDGTMGWHLAGFELEHGSTRQAQIPSVAAMEKALAAAERVSTRFGVSKVTAEEVENWLLDLDRTTYLLDVRSLEEYLQGHLPGFVNAPGGQLVQATDEYVAVKNSYLVLADDVGVRATMTASWLIQMGWQHVFVLEGGTAAGVLESGNREPTLLGEMGEATVTTEALASTLDKVIVIDLSLSTEYENQHIPGALWCVRARLNEVIGGLPESSVIVLTSTDGLLAKVALPEAQGLGNWDVQALIGGTEQWLDEHRVTVSGLEHVRGETDDVWYKPYEHRGAQEKFMRDYLTWEVALVEQIERDATTQFRLF
jgi:rhodanese-related sulfurtransferase